MRELELVIEEVLMNVSRYSYPEGAPGMVTVSYSVPAPGKLALRSLRSRDRIQSADGQAFLTSLSI